MQSSQNLSHGLHQTQVWLSAVGMFKADSQCRWPETAADVSTIHDACTSLVNSFLSRHRLWSLCWHWKGCKAGQYTNGFSGLGNLRWICTVPVWCSRVWFVWWGSSLFWLWSFGCSEKPICTPPHHQKFTIVAFEMDPVSVWVTMALSRPFKENHLAPLSPRWLMVWCPWLSACR